MSTVMKRRQNPCKRSPWGLGALAGIVFVLGVRSAALAQPAPSVDVSWPALAQVTAPPQLPARFSRPEELYEQALHSIDRGELGAALHRNELLG